MKRLLVAFITSILPVSVLMLSIQTSWAASATWLSAPPTGDWNSAANWTAGGPPNGLSDTATFATSNVTGVFLSAATEVNGISFNAGASPFTITASPMFSLTISGIGITNNSGTTQVFVADVNGSGQTGNIYFNNSATAGTFTSFTNKGGTVFGGPGGSTQFFNASTAGGATFTNENDGVAGAGVGTTLFTNTSTAGNGSFSNNGATDNGGGGETSFVDTSTAGNGTFTNKGGIANGGSGGSTQFSNASTAGGATFTNNGGVAGAGSGLTLFTNDSTAGNGSFSNNGGGVNGGAGVTIFVDTSTAGNGTFTNEGGTAFGGGGGSTQFFNASTASGATFTNNGGVAGAVSGYVLFADTSTAGNGTFTNNGGAVSGEGGGVIYFQNTSAAANATVIANGGVSNGLGGTIHFEGDSTGDTSLIDVFGNGTGDFTNGNLDISLHSDPGVTIGSIEGSGAVFLGAFNLTVGSNNLSTTFSGVMQDGGLNGGTGGSLGKTGTGTLTLSGANTYTGGTTVSAGSLQASHDGALGSGDVSLTTSGATLTLDSGTTNNYIADTAILTIASGSTINLNFTGTPDTVASLIVNGVTQAPGIYGSAASGAPHQLPEFTGPGTILVPAGPTPTPTPTPGPPVITSPLVATGTVGLPFTYQFMASGATSLGVSNPAPGLTFDASLAAIVGTPTAAGTFQIGLSATNSFGTTNATLVLTVQPFPASGPVTTSVTSATGRTGSPFHFQVATSGGSAATRVSATGLPAGLSLDSVTGEISGTATTDGSFLVTLSTTEAGITNTATLQLTFTSDLAVPVIVSPNSAALYPGLPFSYQIEAPTSDSSDPVTYSELGPLPLGLGLDPMTGIISGTPQLSLGLQPTPALAGGVVTNVQIFACNSSGCSAQGLFFLLPTGAANISTRLSVGTDENVLIGGFITDGTAPMKLVVHGIGPSLPLGGLLADPYLELHSGAVTTASNDNWKDNLAGGSQEVAIENTGLAPTNDLESAILGVLDPGAYTAIMSGTSNGTGVGLVEVYNLGAASMDVSSEAHLANISTRGFVQTGDNVMIGGFINQGSVPIKVLVRGIGPSLTPFGVSGALANPVLELHKPDGIVVTNDDWMTDPTQKTAITATGLAPKNELESAILITLPVGEGLYTAIVRGANDTTGVGLVEAYFGNPCLGTSCP